MTTTSIVCPVCEKGQLKEEEKYYKCNHFKSLDDKCDFTIWKNISNKTITLQIVQELATNKTTSFLNGFVTKEGREFSAALTIDQNNKVTFKSDVNFSDAICVNCNGKIIETAYAYKCENTFDKSCHISVPKIIASKTLPKTAVLELLEGKVTSLINGFISNSGKHFATQLYIDDNDFKVKFKSDITKCPQCTIGNIIAYEKAYSCSNFKSENPCKFSIWRQQYGADISIENVIELTTTGKTNVITFATKEGNHPYKGILLLNEEFKTTMQKEK